MPEGNARPVRRAGGGLARWRQSVMGRGDLQTRCTQSIGPRPKSTRHAIVLSAKRFNCPRCRAKSRTSLPAITALSEELTTTCDCSP